MIKINCRSHLLEAEAGSGAWRLSLSLPVHLAQNNTVRDEIAGFYKQTEKGGAKQKAQFKSRFRYNHDLIKLINLANAQRG